MLCKQKSPINPSHSASDLLLSFQRFLNQRWSISSYVSSALKLFKWAVVSLGESGQSSHIGPSTTSSPLGGRLTFPSRKHIHPDNLFIQDQHDCKVAISHATYHRFKRAALSSERPIIIALD